MTTTSSISVCPSRIYPCSAVPPAASCTGPLKICPTMLSAAGPDTRTTPSAAVCKGVDTAATVSSYHLSLIHIWELERILLLKNVDKYWMDHLDAIEELRRGVSLRSYGNRDPLVEYSFESDTMFNDMISTIKSETVKQVISVRIVEGKEIKRQQVAKISAEGTAENIAAEKRRPKVKTAAEKVGRNDPCPCGSGKKYKKCCGREQGAD